MKLSVRQAELLQHRLDVPDALYDCMFSTYEVENLPEPDKDLFEQAVDRVADWIKKKTLPEAKTLNQYEHFILVECLEGSTWCACMYGSPDHKSHVLVMKNLGYKFIKQGFITDPAQWPTI